MKRTGWLAVVALVSVLGCGGGSTMASADDVAPQDASGSHGSADPALVACVTATNQDRATLGLAPLAESSALEAYAATGAMVDYNSSPHDHFSSTNGGGIAFAENECPQQGNWNLSFGDGDLTKTVQACVAAFFAEGPGSDYSTHGHYINMTGNYATLGCGIYQQGQQLTIVQDYGD